MNTNTTAPDGVVSSTEFGHLEKLMREFEEWAYVRDFDTTRSAREPQRYANERTQGAWQAWGHGTANWRENRDMAVDLLRECEQALNDTTGPWWPARIDLRNRVRRSLGMESPNTTNEGREASPSITELGEGPERKQC